MKYGPLRPRGLPQQDPERLMLLADRYRRACAPHDKWAETAKKCVDFVEGRQWAEDAKRKLEKQGRPALTFNKIAPLVRLVLGYHRNNRTDTRAIPADDGQGDDQIAEAISRIFKQVSQRSDEPSRDAEVFLDAIMTGRGFWDLRLNFENNDFGEIDIGTDDPFSLKIDPDHDDYDLNKAGYIVTDKWINLDQIRANYGDEAADLLAPIARGATPIGPIMSDNNPMGDIRPVRKFGLEENDFPEWWANYNSAIMDIADPLRRNIRLLDFQYWETQTRNVFIDLETGDRSVIPQDWDGQRIQKALYYADLKQNPLQVRSMQVRQVRWTTIIGDLMVHDDASPYNTFSKIGYFPWFRRGYTQGMVQDLLDAQEEVNKRRSVQIETVMRTSHSGWMYHEHSLDPAEEAKLRQFGAAPGIHIKWKGDTNQKPSKIEASPPPTSMERLEMHAQDDIKQQAGINDSALGELDRVQSGRALEARQRQAVIALQVYMDNFHRSKKLLGVKKLELVQNHYTEPRIFRILGENGQFLTFAINKEMQDPASGIISKLNDVTIGKYGITVDEAPLSASFLNAQFEEAMMLAEKLQLPPMILADILVDLSSMPRKEEIKQRLQGALGLPPTGSQPGQPGAPVPGQPPMIGHNGGPPMEGAPSLDQSQTPAGNVVMLPVGQPQPMLTRR